MVFKFLSVIMVVVAVVLGTCGAVSAAVITGGIYDAQFEAVSNVIVTINTTPEQTVISRFGGYYFEVFPGFYRIEVLLTDVASDRRVLIGYDEFAIMQDGQYRRDIFIDPSINITSPFFANGLDATDDMFVGIFAGWPMLLIGFAVLVLLLVIVGGVLYGVQWYAKRKRTSGVTRTVVDSVKFTNEDVGAKERIFEVLVERGGTSTQKFIRKQVPLSESKISMIIAELEREGVVEKIKQGRSNTIRIITKKE